MNIMKIMKKIFSPYYFLSIYKDKKLKYYKKYTLYKVNQKYRTNYYPCRCIEYETNSKTEMKMFLDMKFGNYKMYGLWKDNSSYSIGIN